MKERVLLLTLIFCFSMIVPGIAPKAGAQGDPFYKGKTIRNKIFDISLADQNLLLVVRDIFEVAGVLRPRLRAVDDPAADPKNAMGFEHECRTLLIHRRIGISVGSRRKKISCQQ